VKKPLSFDQISEMLKIPYEEIQFLNPSYKQGVIPATNESPFMLRLRKKYIGSFINNEMMLYAYRTRKGFEQDSLLAIAYQNSRETKEYKVKSGETMASIAKKFHMTTAELKSLNSLKKNSVHPKQNLLVYASPPRTKPQEITLVVHSAPDTAVKQNRDPAPSTAVKQEHAAAASKESPSKDAKAKRTGTTKSGKGANPKYVTYTVQPGDNLWDIAEKFDGVTVADIKKLNKITNAQRIQTGQKLKIMPAK
jgi:membrane-bound lytic murein transglycosylase D